MKHIPHLFTLLNLVFGCLAIVFILQNGIIISGDEDGSTWIDIPEKVWFASFFIALAAIVDFLDGFVARIFHAESAKGKQLDSLADVVSFGVAPGMILYQFLRLSYARQTGGLDTSFLWLLPAFFIPCAAAWRLARFSLDTNQFHSFKGMPAPAVGILIASFPLIYWNVNKAWIIDLLLNKWFLYAVIGFFSWLMLSSLPFMAMKFKDFSLRNNFARYSLILISVITLIFMKWLGIPVIVLAYVVLSLLFKNKIA